MPNPSDLHVDRVLTNFAVDYKNNDFIATQAVPVVMVNNKSDNYYVYTKKDRFSIPETILGPKDKANEVDWSASTDSYGCINHGLREFIADATVANADTPIDPRRRTTDVVTDLLLLKLEKDTATDLTTAGNYGNSYKTTLTGGDQWSAFATSDPIANIDTAKNACFYPANTLIMGKEVYDKLKRHPQLLDHVKGGASNSNPAKVTLQLMAELFEVERILVGKAKYNSSNKAQTASYDYLWGKYCIAAYIPPGELGVETVAWRKLFVWRQMVTNSIYKVRRYRDEHRGGGGEWIEVNTSYVDKEVCSDLAYLISGAVA